VPDPLTHPQEGTPDLDAPDAAANDNLLLASDVSAIRNWLAAKVATHLQVEPGEIDVTAPLRDFGLDSIAVFNVTGELAERLGRNLTSTLLWDFPTIDALARHLADPAESRDESS
jgi:acyl carrier protein